MKDWIKYLEEQYPNLVLREEDRDGKIQLQENTPPSELLGLIAEYYFRFQRVGCPFLANEIQKSESEHNRNKTDAIRWRILALGFEGRFCIEIDGQNMCVTIDLSQQYDSEKIVFMTIPPTYKL